MITKQDVFLIKETCSTFIKESNGFPVLKNLPITYPDVKKVKVRHQHIDQFGEVFNKAFSHQIYERCVFANGMKSFKPILDEQVTEYDIFYIFVPDSYKFLYNPIVRDINETSFDKVHINILPDLLKFSFKNTDLVEGITGDTQLIIYDIPFFYCVRSSQVDYDKLIEWVS